MTVVRILFLDDDPVRHEGLRNALNGTRVDLTMVETVEEAVAALRAHVFEVILLDHDLGGQIYVPSGPGTGFEVAQRLMETPNRNAQVIVHSVNEAGARAMLDVLGPNAIWVPFPSIKPIVNAIKLRAR